jgi:hypothetical protein
MVDLQGTDEHLRLIFPRNLWFSEEIVTFPSEIDFKHGQVRIINDQRAHVALEVDSPDGGAERALRHFFAHVHGYPTFPKLDYLPVEPKPDPLISCIIVLTENDCFVRNVLLPSLICNSNEQIEIIVVSNGTGSDVSLPSNVQLISSDYRWVARAYNRGVEASSGRYVALFHDDCLIDDSHWIKKCVTQLQDGCTAVSPQILQRSDGLQVAKGVPLVMERDDYVRFGGHDEEYFFGLEDIDFTYGILQEGEEVREVNLDTLHFNGMSSILVAYRSLNHERLLSCHVLPQKVVQALSYSVVDSSRQNSVFQALTDRNYFYFALKFEDLLRHQKSDFAEWKSYYASRATLWKRLSPETWEVAASPERLTQHYQLKDGILDPEDCERP